MKYIDHSNKNKIFKRIKELNKEGFSTMDIIEQLHKEGFKPMKLGAKRIGVGTVTKALGKQSGITRKAHTKTVKKDDSQQLMALTEAILKTPITDEHKILILRGVLK